MKYSENEVINILKQLTNSPKKILREWNINKSNTPIDEKSEAYNQWVFSFPIIINDEEVATITLVSLYGGGLNGIKDNMMQKYFGYDQWKKSFWTFSHDTYLDCYLTIHKQFELDKLTEGFYGQKFQSKDNKGIEFNFTICLGYPTSGDDYKDSILYNNWVNNAYRFDNDVNIMIDKIQNGFILGQQINKKIKQRLRDKKINDIIENES